MQKFTFTALKADGTKTEGAREAADRYGLARDLRKEGLTVTTIEEVGAPGSKKKFSFGGLFGRTSIKDKIIFASSLSAMVGAGLSLSRALEVVGRQTTNKKFKALIVSISERVTKGESLSQALSNFPDTFPPVFGAMVAAGEESGNLPQSLEIVRQQLSKSYDLQRKVKGAMLYPAIIISVIIIIAILMMIFLVPQLTSIFKEMKVELPLSTRLVVATSDFLSNHTLAFFIALVATIFVVVKLLRTTRGKRVSTKLLMRTPVLKVIIANVNAAVTMRTIASLVSSGVSMINALEITAKVLQNPFYKEVVVEAEGAIQKGATLSSVFKQHEKICPILVGEMAEVGEETGNLSGMLLKGAAFFEEEVDQATKNLSTIIEPVLMIIIGIFVGFFAISMLGPMYSLSNAI